MKKTLKIICEGILNILVIIAIIILIFSVYIIYQVKIQNKQYATILGYTALEVITGSMAGTIDIGDLVIVEETQDVNVNDIIVYRKDEDLITHRIVKKDGETIITKGDANNTEDDPITIQDVVGKVRFTIKNVGIWKDVFSSPVVLACITVTIILFGIAIMYKPKNKMEEKQESGKE